jgi:hypothetical protein
MQTEQIIADNKRRGIGILCVWGGGAYKLSQLEIERKITKQVSDFNYGTSGIEYHIMITIPEL